MKKTLNINLGGLAFIIDENAFELLNNYLETLKRKFDNEAERKEILHDIEARIAEMLNQKLAGGKEVIGMEDVQSVMDIMGKPEDIAGEETATGSSSTGSSTATGTASTAAAPVSKKLFRDPDDSKIGGVISGLCHYFGINDPVWVRIAALILIPFTSGSIILFYLLLLIIVPKAYTAAEKLQMKGEPVNINTIQKEIKDAAGKAGDAVNRFVKEENLFHQLWNIFVTVFVALLKIFAAFVLVMATISLIGILIGYSGFYMWGTSSMAGVSHLLVEKTSTINLFGIGFLLFGATPFVAVIYLGLRAIIGQRSSVPWLKWSLLGAWVLGLILLIVSTAQVLVNFRTESVRRQQVALAQPARGNLHVQLSDLSGKKMNTEEDEDQGSSHVDFNGFFVNGVNINDIDQIPMGKPVLQLMPSENDSFYVQEIISSHGRNKKDAEKNADMIAYSLTQSDSLVNLSHRIYLPKNGKWRNQDMIIRIAIPEGKKISFADNIDFWEATVKNESNYDDTQFANTTWTCEAGKIKCLIGENHRNAHQEDISDPEKDHSKPHTHVRIKHNHKDKDSDSDDKDY